MNYLRKRDGPLKFFSADWVQRPPQLVRGAVMLVRKTCSISFKRAAVFSRATFDGVINEKHVRAAK